MKSLFGEKEDSIFCDLCKLWVHIHCNQLNCVDYQHLSNQNDPWFCFKCNSDIFPLGKLNKQNLESFIKDNNPKSDKEKNNETKTLVLKPPPNLTLLFNQFNNTSDDLKDPENVVNSRYYDIKELQTMNIPNKNNCLSMFHINACSLNRNFDDLQYLLKTTNINFDVIAISETRITKDKGKLTNLNLENYVFEHTPTESTAGGTLLYIANHLAYKPRCDLNIYKNYELESTFIEIINPKKSNIIVGCIYRHPNMELNEFNTFHLNPLLEKLAKENKQIFLLGDFNIDLSKYDQHNQTNEFLDSLTSNMIVPYIIQPTRITSHSNTIIDNIFSNIVSSDIISGNLTATISDHLPQFLIAPDIFSNSHRAKHNISERDWTNFDQENFILDYLSTNWTTILKLQDNDVNISLQNFLNRMTNLLDTYAPI